MDPTDLTTQIVNAASGPQSAEADGVRVQSQDPMKAIEADAYLASKSATKKASRGLRITQLLPPAAV